MPPSSPDTRISGFALGAGETAVLTEVLARPGNIAVTDDGAARSAANALGLRVTGSVGVLLLAHRQQRISTVAPELRHLKAAGLYLPSDAMLRLLLANVGEPWP